MSRLDDAKRGLKLFEEKAEIKHIRMQLKLIEKNCFTGDIEALRITLKAMLKEAHPTLLTEALHNSMLAIAKFAPLNLVDVDTNLPICPITLEPITSSERVVSSSGHQFNLPALVNFKRARHPHEDIWINPLTNKPFSILDAKYIKKKAQEKVLILEDKSIANTTLLFFKPPNRTSNCFVFGLPLPIFFL